MVKISRKIFFLLIFLFLLSTISNAILVHQNYSRNIVVKVVDGDSLDLADGRRVRLLGVDAPEKGNCQAEEARQVLSNHALGKHIRLKNIVKDAYGRILANVIVEDFPTWVAYLRWRFFTNKQDAPFPSPDPYLNRLIISRGLAWNTDSNTSEYKEQIKRAESYAKEKRLGIWSSECLQLVPPDKNCLIKGNRRGDTKNYHMLRCRNYDQVIVNTAYGDRWFCSEEEAEKAGFEEAKGCQ